MMAPPNSTYKPEFFKRTKGSSVAYDENINIEWIVSGILFHFRCLNHFPTNPLNEDKTIMQSKNGQELPARQGNFLVQQLLEE